MIVFTQRLHTSVHIALLCQSYTEFKLYIISENIVMCAPSSILFHSIMLIRIGKDCIGDWWDIVVSALTILVHKNISTKY